VRAWPSHGGDVGHQAQLVAQEAVHFVGDLGGGRVLGQQGANDVYQMLALAGVDDAGGIDAGGAGLFDLVVGAVEQAVLSGFVGRAVLVEAVAQGLGGAGHLRRYELFLLVVLLGEAIRCFAEKPGLLLDQQQIACGVDDGEVDFADQGVALVDARPVHAVIDGVGIGQTGGEQCQGLDLAPQGAAQPRSLGLIRIALGRCVARFARRPLATRAGVRPRRLGTATRLSRRWIATRIVVLAWLLGLPRHVLTWRAVGTVTRRQGDFEFDEFVPLGLAALAVWNRQQGL
jgi:hypothetical protein